jgi:hypothetical protein
MIMNGEEKKMVIRLEERITNIQDDIKEIKIMVGSIQGCINSNEMAISKLDNSLANHIKDHRLIASLSKDQWTKIVSICAVISAVVGIVSYIVTMVV